MQIIHVISSLEIGGAEGYLARLVSALQSDEFANTVVSMTSGGALAGEIERAGVPVVTLDMQRGGPSVSGLMRLVSHLRKSRPAIVQSWLYHADLLALAACRLAGVSPLIWNVRSSDMDMSRYRLLSRTLVPVLARLSRLPNAVIVNSEAGQHSHELLGYRPREWAVIPNGVDTGLFRPRAAARAELRAELGFPQDVRVLGCVARYDPMKGHDVLLKAMAQLSKKGVAVHLLLIGRDTESLAGQVAALGLEGMVSLLGERRDVDSILPGLEGLVCASESEGFPNAVAEAMACGIPCVVTDVGDSARLIGDTGFVVPPLDAQAMADAMVALCVLAPAERKRLGEASRRRAVEDFAVEESVEAYRRLYRRHGQQVLEH